MSSLGWAVNGTFSKSCSSTLSGILNPLYEWAEWFILNPKDGTTVLALKSRAEIGSPAYRILSGLSSFRVVKFVPIAPPILPPAWDKPAVNKPSSVNPVAASTPAPIEVPTAVPKPWLPLRTKSFIFWLFPPKLPATTGVPNVFTCLMPTPGIPILSSLYFLLMP